MKTSCVPERHGVAHDRSRDRRPMRSECHWLPTTTSTIGNDTDSDQRSQHRLQESKWIGPKLVMMGGKLEIERNQGMTWSGTTRLPIATEMPKIAITRRPPLKGIFRVNRLQVGILRMRRVYRITEFDLTEINLPS
jgi:hypothetical protein